MHDIKTIYDSWHRNLPVDSAAATPWHRMILEAITAEDVAGRNVLEIGCGRGGFACRLAQTWPDIRLVAADFSDAAVEMGRLFAESENLRGIEWRVADIQSIPYADNSFDTVISCETIEHVPNPRAALRELARVLRPGGRLFLTSPNYFNLAGVHRIYREIFRGQRFQEEGQPINHFTLLPQVCHWVRQVGLTVIRVRSVNHSIPYPGRPGIIIRALERAPFPFPWLGSNSFILAKKSVHSTIATQSA